MELKSEWDLIVVGGGPAGMMAAGQAGHRGLRVLLLEQNQSLGKKLLLSGGGRCNFTNAEPDPRKLAEKYGKRGAGLISLFTRFSSGDCLEFFQNRGMAYKIEDNFRAFPVSNDSDSVLDILRIFMKESHVTIKLGAQVQKIVTENGRVTGVQTRGQSFTTRAVVLATGGQSRPETGSTGDGFRWLGDLGIKIRYPEPSLVPVKVQEPWIGDLMGLSFPEARLSVFQEGKRLESRKGKLLITHFGLSGPLVLNLSRLIGEAAKAGAVDLVVDFRPETDEGALDREILDLVGQNSNKMVKNVLGSDLPPRLTARLIQSCGIDGDKPLRQMTKEERKSWVTQVKNFRLKFHSLLDESKAVVTSGGLHPDEVDFRTMELKKVPGLLVAGDLLDIDRPTGGYSLQICWATGWVAGQNCLTPA